MTRHTESELIRKLISIRIYLIQSSPPYIYFFICHAGHYKSHDTVREGGKKLHTSTTTWHIKANVGYTVSNERANVSSNWLRLIKRDLLVMEPKFIA